MKEQIRRNIYKNALNHFGINHQEEVCIEELSELIHAIIKSRRNKDRERKVISNNLIEEIADVEIMLAQLKISLKADNMIETHKDLKLERLQKRIEGKHE